MKKPLQQTLSRRERQIMDIVYRLGEASVSDVVENLVDAPSYSAVRATMRLLEEKGHLRHFEEGARYVYQATVNRDQASRSAMHHLLQTFFDGSPERAVAALLDVSNVDISPEELDRLSSLIEQARKEGR